MKQAIYVCANVSNYVCAKLLIMRTTIECFHKSICPLHKTRYSSISVRQNDLSTVLEVTNICDGCHLKIHRLRRKRGLAK
jgi:hypothetical protein